jgi:protein-S-isoprenylcysteine O-methyltransferase Ste14
MTNEKTQPLLIVGLIVAIFIIFLSYTMLLKSLELKVLLFPLSTVNFLVVGLIMIKLLHYLSIKKLRKNWTDSSIVKEGGSLIITGLYRYVRHPIYTMFLLEGLLIGFLSPYALILALIEISIPFVRLILKKEEENLIHYYGDEYLEYKKLVRYRLIPFIY